MRLGESYRVEQLVPHRGPMCLLDRIDGYGVDWLRASVDIRADGPFATADGVPAWVGIEYMAQAAAAFGGIDQVQRGEAPSIGLLIGARYYRCMIDTFPIGMRVGVLARIALRDADDFAAYECTLEGDGRQLAECTLKAYRPHDLAAVISGDFAGGRRG